MRAFYDIIKAKVAADLTDIKTCRLWREQFVHVDIDRNENAFRYPALFVEFVPTEYFNYTNYRDADLIVRFHVGVESLYMEKEMDLDLMDKIDRVFYKFRGNETDNAFFTSWTKNIESDTADDDNTNLLVVEYRTRLREIDTLAGDFVDVSPTTLDLTAEIKD